MLITDISVYAMNEYGKGYLLRCLWCQRSCFAHKRVGGLGSAHRNMSASMSASKFDDFGSGDRGGQPIAESPRGPNRCLGLHVRCSEALLRGGCGQVIEERLGNRIGEMITDERDPRRIFRRRSLERLWWI